MLLLCVWANKSTFGMVQTERPIAKATLSSTAHFSDNCSALHACPTQPTCNNFCRHICFLSVICIHTLAPGMHMPGMHSASPSQDPSAAQCIALSSPSRQAVGTQWLSRMLSTCGTSVGLGGQYWHAHVDWCSF